MLSANAFVTTLFPVPCWLTLVYQLMSNEKLQHRNVNNTFTVSLETAVLYFIYV